MTVDPVDLTATGDAAPVHGRAHTATAIVVAALGGYLTTRTMLGGFAVIAWGAELAENPQALSPAALPRIVRARLSALHVRRSRPHDATATAVTARHRRGRSVPLAAAAVDTDSAAATEVRIRPARNGGLVRNTTRVAVAVLVIAGAFALAPKLRTTTTVPARQAITDHAGTALVATALEKARLHHATAGTFVGTELPGGVRAATGRNVFVVATTEGACAYAAIYPGKDSVVETDPTGQLCQKSEIHAAQMSINDAGA